jgi:hypothetical protein
MQDFKLPPLKMGPICCPETSVTNHQHRLRNIPQERRSHVHTIRWIEEAPFSEVKWPNCEVGNSSAKVKNGWSLISTIAIRLSVVVLSYGEELYLVL